jgi:hypothetical protein
MLKELVPVVVRAACWGVDAEALAGGATEENVHFVFRQSGGSENVLGVELLNVRLEDSRGLMVPLVCRGVFRP